MDLKEIRNELDVIDNELVNLINKRMGLIENVAEYKKENHIPILDPQREREKKQELGKLAGEENAKVVESLFSYIFDMSRAKQQKLITEPTDLAAKIKSAIENMNNTLPERVNVACQGIDGSYSQQACQHFFPNGNIVFTDNFEAVFSAIDQGLCQYGVLPIENSTAGSVNKIYKLMMNRNFYIVRSCRVKVDHCLLSNKGAKLEDIKEIYSHEQALAQCSDFLNTLKNVKIIPCENTAMAARKVFESGSKNIAAISSRACSELYNLEILKDFLANQGNNYTRFICISKKLEIYPAANRTSLMMVLPNKPGSLYKVLAYFNALGVNLLKLESRPLPNSDFEFMFYFDLDCSIYSPEFIQIFNGLDSFALSVKYLGTYLEEI